MCQCTDMLIDRPPTSQLADLPYLPYLPTTVVSVLSVLSGVPVPIHGQSVSSVSSVLSVLLPLQNPSEFRTPTLHMRISYLHIIRNPSTNLPKSRTEEQHAAEPRRTQSPIILIPLCHSQRPVRADSTESITESGSKTTSPLDPPSRLT